MDNTSQQPELLKLSMAIAPLAHIRQIRLLRSSVECDCDQASTPSPLHHAFDATTTLDSVAGSLVVHACLEVSAGRYFHITADYVLVYKIDKPPVGITPETATAFGKMNGIHNIWPYWREYVQSTSTRAGFPPFPIPLMTVGSMLDYYGKKEKALDAAHVPSEQ
jgi:hypothetical protein